jgi:uncharacterized protein YndB with AHSA1/START domain
MRRANWSGKRGRTRNTSTSGGDGDADDVQFQVTVSFVEEGGKTRLTMRLLFESSEECEKTKAFGAVQGGNQTLDRLAEHLAKMA